MAKHLAWRVNTLVVAELNSSLAGLSDQSYLYVTPLIKGKKTC